MKSGNWLSWVLTAAVLAAVVIPMTMISAPDVAGLVQRIMFGIGYVWYGLEAASVARSSHLSSANYA